ncbi:site-specific integrase [Candidatus Uhrbacteria bacterium]|nr:site-specific integrase [Candidatus Uhrbacteria bacterium]
MNELKDKTIHTQSDDQIRYQNELIKRQYFDYMRDSKGFCDDSIKTYEKAMLLWQDFSGEEDFGCFNKDRAKRFKKWLAERPGKIDTKLSLSYQYDSLRKLQGFLTWLSMQDQYKSRINRTDIDFLNLGKKEKRQALQQVRKKSPTLEQIKATIETIKPNTEVDMRDRALLSLTLLSGARISAITSLPMRAFDRTDCILDQNPRYGVKTKNSKKITTALFPLSYKEPRQYFLDWYDYLESKRGFGPDDPIFPATKREQGEKNISYYSSGNVGREFWSSSSSARKIFEKRYIAAGVPYFNPHSLRHLVVKECMKMPLTEEQKKAVSQNLGHAQVTTTFGSYGYGQISEDRQIELLKEIASGNGSFVTNSRLTDEEITRIAEALNKSK